MYTSMRTKKPGDYIGGGWDVVECKKCGDIGITKGARKRVFHEISLYQKPSQWLHPCKITKKVIREYNERQKQTEQANAG